MVTGIPYSFFDSMSMANCSQTLLELRRGTRNIHEDEEMLNRLSLVFNVVITLITLSATARSQTVPNWVGNLMLQNSNITADPTMTAPEAQGLGQKFELLFSMMNAQDPQNIDNDVITLNTGAFPSNLIGVAVRNMLPGAKIASLTNQISIKYLFVPPRTC